MNPPFWSRRAATLGVAGMLALPMATLGPTAQAQSQARTERLIVINSYVAEIVVALGGAPLVVAVGGGTDHIAALAKVPRLPGFRQTSAEPLLALSPTRVFISNEWVVPQTLDQLRNAGVQVDVIDGEHSPAGVERRIRFVASVLGKVTEGEALVQRFQREMQEMAALVAKVKRRPKALFILAGGQRPTLVGGRGTNVAALLELAGAENVAKNIEGFKAMSQEAMIEAAPEYILTNPDGMVPRDGVPVALQAPGALATPAGKAGRLITVPGQYLQGMGILTPEGIRLLGQRLHPEVFR